MKKMIQMNLFFLAPKILSFYKWSMHEGDASSILVLFPGATGHLDLNQRPLP
ncbi:hypothetical protein SOVF_158050 [Spinacia oleracea]|nr:hypothetical protein SOVF_158050 [Spinacia oleracea]